MIILNYSDRTNKAISVRLCYQEELHDVLAKTKDSGKVGELSAIVLERDGLATLTFAQVEGGAVLMWMPSTDLCFHSQGDGTDDNTVSFRINGEYTEVPASYVVKYDLAVEAAVRFVETGVPGVIGLEWEQDF